MLSTMRCMRRARSGEDDVVDRNEDELDEVANNAHDCESHHACLQNLHVLGVVWLLALIVEVSRVPEELVDLGGNILLLLLLVS